MNHKIIALEELREIANLLFDELHKSGFSQIHLNHDFYWSFVGDPRYNLEDSPELTLGQLYDDIEFLRQAKAERDFMHTHLWNLAGLFNYIADKGDEVLNADF